MVKVGWKEEMLMGIQSAFRRNIVTLDEAANLRKSVHDPDFSTNKMNWDTYSRTGGKADPRKGNVFDRED